MDAVSVPWKLRSPWSEAKTLAILRDLRERTRAGLVSQRAILSVPVPECSTSNHPADRDEIVGKSLAASLIECHSNRLTQIEAAIKAVRDGTYGLCQECGGVIGFERIEALPYAQYCVSCQRERERRR